LSVVPTGGYAPEAEAWFNAVVAAGSSIITANKDAVNAFVVGCKADGIWTSIGQAFLLCAAADLTGALVPLKGTAPTNRNFVSGDYSRTTGLVGNASNKDLVTNRNNNVDAQNNRGIGVWRTTSETRTGNCTAIGSASGTGEALLFSSTVARIGRNPQSSAGVSLADTSQVAGYWGIVRTSASDNSMRYNGADTAGTSTSETPSSGSLYVFSRAGSIYSNARISFYWAGASLTQSLLDARLATLMSSLT